MTTISLPSDQRSKLRRLLRQAGRREIGGVLMGEQVAHDSFRVVGFTVDGCSGTETHFLRRPERHLGELAEFFERTGQDYSRYNYLGEWHSHPSFPVVPSDEDARSMTELVHGEREVEFAALLIVRLHFVLRLEAGCYLFARRHPMARCVLTR